MDAKEIINLARRANFSAKDYRIRIEASVIGHLKDSHDRFSMSIYIGHLAKLGLGTQVLDVTYDIYFNGQFHIAYLDVFRPGRWIKRLERSAIAQDREKEVRRIKEMKEEERLHSPVDDSWIFRN